MNNDEANAAAGDGSGGSSGEGASSSPPRVSEKRKEKARVSRTSLILWHAHQNDVSAVRKLLEEDRSLVNALDYDRRTPLHVAALQDRIDVAKCLLEYGADVNAQDRWNNTPLADAEGAKKEAMIHLLKSNGGLSFGQDGSHFEAKSVPPPLPNKCDWEIDPSELDFTTAALIGKILWSREQMLAMITSKDYQRPSTMEDEGSFGEIIKAYWRGTPVAVKRILPSLSDDRLVVQDFRHEVHLLVKLRHPNIVQFLGAVTDRKPLMLITEFLRGGDLHQFLEDKGPLGPSLAINFALDMARGMAYLHNEPNVIIHRDLKPRNVLLVNSNADHLKVGDFGLSKLIRVEHSHDVYKMTGETGSYRYMAPEVFKHRKYDKKVDVFSFAMILYEMLEGVPPFSAHKPYEAAKLVAEGKRPLFHNKGYIQELRDLTVQCWAMDMNKRPTFLEILRRLEKLKESLPSDHHWNIFAQ
ncbi:hypothetical protein ZIOFF_049217 [Zingiber officinale]|uniref:non-specific serine/threonine protein kinase n=1 Tax=Zingiber officinale TaxID=94328 RepID=A0A8J5FSE9_ZINOF|nr:hypothetical protein ZIOFF_049217 [Zingiber officinale]